MDAMTNMGSSDQPAYTDLFQERWSCSYDWYARNTAPIPDTPGQQLERRKVLEALADPGVR